MLKLLTTPEVAEMLGVQPNTLERWRITGFGPQHIRVGRLVKYRSTDIEAWIESQCVQSTSQQAA